MYAGKDMDGKKSLKIGALTNRIRLWKGFCDIFFMQEGIGPFHVPPLFESKIVTSL